MDVGTPQPPEEDQPSTKKADGDTQSKRNPQGPNRIIAGASVVLAVATIGLLIVTGLYTYYAREQARLTTDMLATMRADQRPWVGYHKYIIQARESPTSPWTDRGPKEGEEFKVRFFVRNVGKTPALNVAPLHIFMGVQPRSLLPTKAEIREEPDIPIKFALFPGDDRKSHNSRIFRLTEEEFSKYSSLRSDIFFWARINYCDSTGKLHWTQTEMSHTFGAHSEGLVIRSEWADTYPSEGAHPSCG